MWLVLSSAGDVSAHWAYQGLACRGVFPLLLIDTESLIHGRWEHWVASGGCRTRITLANGFVVESDQVRGVLNRIVGVPPWLFAGGDDRDYAFQELHALLLSWLHSLPATVINRAVPQGLCGAWRHNSQWVRLAARAGLSVPVYRRASTDRRAALFDDSPLFPPGTSTRTVLVLGGETFGSPVPPDVARGCRELARLAATSLLGVELTAGEDGAWTFAGASPLPELQSGGEPFLDLLAAVLRSEERPRRSEKGVAA
jgi:hypothetical protein